jgi:gamma-glutamyltranspeptidase/glutathione hydrolase
MRFRAVHLAAAGFGLGVLLSACAPVAPAPEATAAPSGDRAAIVTADPRATDAGLAMLRRGGTAIDAAIAAQAVLGLVEPQASGFLGGSLLVTKAPDSPEVTVYDGMPTAPAQAPPSVSVSRSGQLLDPREVAFSPRAVGVPGTLPVLEAAHTAFGRLPWADLFAPALALAEQGTPVSRTLHDLLAQPGATALLGDVAKPYEAADGTVLPVGAVYRNPAYAEVLRRVARLGARGLYADGGLAAVLHALDQPPHPSLITAADLLGYRPRVGPALCAPFDRLRLCTAPPPSLGGVVMLQILAMAGTGDLTEPGYLHRFLEASRLAEADRRRYLADPAFFDVPLPGLLDPGYLATRAAGIPADHSIDHPMPGTPPGLAQDDARAIDPGAPQAGTSALAVVDASGRALAMTSTINLHFGARIGAMGMVFNNALINFAPPPPTTLPGTPGRYANEMDPGKRPLTPIAPTLALGADGGPVLVAGGAGGAAIPDTLAALMIDVLGRHLPLAEALAAPHADAADPDHISLETGSSPALRDALVALGHRVEIEPVDSGNVALLRDGAGWQGAADPRRDGSFAGLR